VDLAARLAGKGIIVTGATSGIGRAIALRCVAEGGRVLAVGRRPDALEALATAAGDALITHHVDLTDHGAAEDAVAACAAHFGSVDGLVHAAGTVWRGQDLAVTSDDAYDAFVEQNLTVTFRLGRAAFRAMTAAGSGSIVLVGSQLAHISLPGYSTYSTVKGAVTAFGRALAVDGGPLGVRANVLAPGVVQTPMAYVDRPDFDSMIAAVAERHPLRRVGQPEDMAGPAAFLLSDDASWVTGHTLLVDGGFTIQ
jgi:NAD(P)-dependent dehydrogenase (short-subunit alcohol dehydrogenase family)